MYQSKNINFVPFIEIPTNWTATIQPLLIVIEFYFEEKKEMWYKDAESSCDGVPCV